MADPDTVFPPVTVYFDGKEYWLADGFHRVAAWRQIGRTDLPADVRQGDRRQAVLHSVAANAAHGLRRTNDDKRRAVLTLLEDAEWSAWSDREIARRCAVHHEMVGRLRASLTGGSASDARTYTTKHGTQATMRTANIGGIGKLESGPEAQENKAEITTDSEVDSAPSRPEEPAFSTTPEEDPAAKVQADLATPALPKETPAQEAGEDPATVKARRDLAKLTPEALIDDVIGLRADLADVKAEVSRTKAENRDLKEKMKDFEGDSAEVIRRLQKVADYEKSKAWRATEAQGAAMKQVYALKKRVAELEQAGIPLNP